MKELMTRMGFDRAVRVPGSKSLTHRALIAASLTAGTSTIHGAVLCEDTLHTLNALRNLGAKIERPGSCIVVQGNGGRHNSPQEGVRLELGNSGTSLRLLLSLASLGPGAFGFSGTPRLCERPVEGLLEALQSMGARIHYEGRRGFLPLRLESEGLRGGRIRLEGGTSSQYVSSLLMAAPCAVGQTEILVRGPMVSRPYIEMTVDVMKSFGVAVERPDERTFIVPAGERYRPCEYSVEGDASSASYFWAGAAVTRGRVVTKGVPSLDTRQGDVEFLHVLERMGCRVWRREDAVTVQGGPLRCVSVDMGDLPDMVPTLAAVALFARGTTEIRNVGHLRFKESDRLAAIANGWRRLGCRVEETPSGLKIPGGPRLKGACLDPMEDHRLAMSLAVVGLRVPGIRIRDHGCVVKSFPGFWRQWETP